jgi:hypothetical protein
MSAAQRKVVSARMKKDWAATRSGQKPPTPVHFFRTLGRLAGTRQQENQLSRTFQACFDASADFRRVVLKTIGAECGVKPNPSANWQCAIEQAGPNGGRVDIHISCHRPDQPVFVLESKVGSPLRKAQLQ